MSRCHCLSSGQRGSSLVELSLVLVIIATIGLFLWKFLPTFKSLPAIQRLTATTLEQSESALTGFVLANSRLPCPDTTGSGLENCSGTTNLGWLPTRTLGLSLSESVRYGVYRTANATATLDADLAALKGRYNPILPPSSVNASGIATDLQNIPASTQQGADVKIINPRRTYTQHTLPAAWSSPLGLPIAITPQLNGLDFCAALLNMSRSPGSNLTAGSQKIPIAYGLAVAGAGDADLDGSPFDGLNRVAGQFELGGTPQSAAYDDQTRTVGAGELLGRLGCNKRLADVNAAARATYAAYEIDRIAILYASFRAFDWTVNISVVQGAEIGLILSTVGLVISTAAELIAINDTELEPLDAAALALTTAALAAAIYGEVQGALNLDSAYEAMDTAQSKQAPAFQWQTLAEADYLAAATRVRDLDGKGLLP